MPANTDQILPLASTLRLSWRLFTFAVVSIMLSSCSQKTSPQIRFPTSEFVLGEGENGELVEGRIEIVNSGDSALVISTITPSCTCSNVTPASNIVIPGHSKSLVSVAIRLPEAFGDQRAQLVIESNDPLLSAATIDVVARAKRRLLISPRELAFGDLSAGQSKSLVATLLTAEGNPPANAAEYICTAESPCLSVSSPVGRDGAIHIVLDTSKCVPGCSHGNVTATHPLSNEIATSYVSAYVTDPVVIIPSRLRLSQSGEGIEITVKHVHGQPLGQLFRRDGSERLTVVDAVTRKPAVGNEYGTSVAHLIVADTGNRSLSIDSLKLWFTGAASPAVLAFDNITQESSSQ